MGFSSIARMPVPDTTDPRKFDRIVLNSASTREDEAIEITGTVRESVGRMELGDLRLQRTLRDSSML